MVVVHDRSKAEKRPMKNKTLDIAPKEQTLEHLKSTLELQRNKCAFVKLDDQGVLRFSSLDKLGSKHRQAIEVATHESSLAASQRDTLISEAAGIEAETDPRGEGTVSNVEPMPQVTIKGRRIFRPTRQRGRSMLPRDASRFSNAPYPPPEQTVRDNAISDTDDEPPVRSSQRKILKSMRIDDSEQITKFIINRLKGMQQLADKKIAKAWIKGICPKKQAKFPYQNRKKAEERGMSPIVPQWWPLSVCRFTEPDHVNRQERMDLCLHLLRLRPTPEQLKVWNQNHVDPNPTHVTQGWTAFLSELAGIEIFDDLPKESPEKTKRRQNLMLQMYEVARREEEYLNGERDGTDLYSYEEDDEERKLIASSKRVRKQSVASLDEIDERRSESVSCTRVKRARKDSSPMAPTLIDRQGPPDQKPDIEMLDTPAPQPMQHHGLPGSSSSNEKDQSMGRRAFPKQDHSAQPTGLSTDPSVHVQPVPMKLESVSDGISQQPGFQAQLWRSYEHNAGHWIDHNASAHFTQQTSGVGAYQPQSAISMFPGKQSYEYPQYHSHGQGQIQVHQVGQVPQPEFHSLPTTPVYSPSGLVPMPFNSYPIHTEQQVPHQQVFTTSMPPNQFFMPAHADPTVADFQPQMDVHDQTYHAEHGELAQRHIAPMPYHAIPFTHPGVWTEHPQQHH